MFQHNIEYSFFIFVDILNDRPVIVLSYVPENYSYVKQYGLSA